ncbi:DUF5079 family protein [Staphylococcus warneri]|uniref:DUF5079 family protein n=1 Tax=Staphylococcus warneri TaxID=1292 RepID=UPI000D1E0098|nr:DUF5079 family protein [Staphylococcus warneri]PTI17228.1 DUF5079 domain-containing protein [Staphylococcus warneri]
MENSLRQLRKPSVQVMNVLSLVTILMAGVQYFFSLTFESTPIYLLITTVIEIIIIILGFIQLFEKSENIKLKTAKRYLIVGCLTAYSTFLSFYNVYFFMAEENHIKLTNFWVVGFLCFIVCASAHICSLLLMSSTPVWLKGDKSIWILTLKIIASTIYIQKIVEYILIPDVAESHFLIIFNMMMMFVSNLLVTQYFLLFGRIYTGLVKNNYKGE